MFSGSVITMVGIALLTLRLRRISRQERFADGAPAFAAAAFVGLWVLIPWPGSIWDDGRSELDD